MKTLALVWGPFGFRSDELAEAVGADRISITFLYGPRYLAPIRYLALFLKTLIILSRAKPGVVYAQNPPVFCPLTSLLYCRLSGSRLVVDHHAVWRIKTVGRGPFSAVIGFLEGAVGRAASANTAPQATWATYLREMGARNILVVHDFVERSQHARDEALRKEHAREPLVCVASHGGHPLERIETEASAVGRFDTVALLISGPCEKLERRLSAFNLPKNVRYLGFLEREKYERLKASVDFAINVTDEPFTLSHVLFEYAAASLPTITNRQEVVEAVFGDSLLYAESSDPQEVAEKVRLMTDASVRDDYRKRVEARFDQLATRHRDESERLRKLFSSTI